MRLSGSGAHWQMGVVERRILTTKTMAGKVSDECDVRGLEATCKAMYHIADAINRSAYEGGFTPKQLLLGHQDRLPG